MIQLTESEKELLKSNSKYIKENKWDKALNNIQKYAYDDKEVYRILQFIYFDCDVDFLNFIDYVPSFMFNYTHIKDLDFLNKYKNLKSLNAYSFSDSGLEIAKIPNYISTISSHAFDNCIYLKEVYLPISLIDISPSTFESCENIEKFYIPNSIKDLIKDNFKYDLRYYSDSIQFIYI